MTDIPDQNQKNSKPNFVRPGSNSNKVIQKRKIKILIAEDQYTCQQIWQSYLEPESDLEIIGIAINGQIAIELVEKLQPDVILMDIHMPIMDGLRATTIITNRYTDIKVLILSISDNIEHIERSLKIGAKGYFLKNSQPQELITAIRNINLGYYQLSSSLIDKLSLDSSIATQQNDRDDGNSDLVELPNIKLTSTSLNSLDILPQEKSRRLSLSSFRLSMLLLLGLLTFLFAPLSRKWGLNFSMFPNQSKDQVETALDSSLTNILSVETTEVSLVSSYQVNRTYTGTIVSRRRSLLGFERQGKLLDLLVNPGEQVEAGMPLAILDTQDLKAKQKELLAERKQVKALLQELQAGSRNETIAAAQSKVKSWQSQLKLAQIKAQRRKELHTSGAISREQLDIATAEVDTIQANLNESQSRLNELLAGTRPEKVSAQQALFEQLDAKLASLAIEIEQSTLKAPFRGIISQQLVDEGSIVSAGKSILTLVEAQTLQVHVGVPINAASQISRGNQYQLQIGSKIYQGKVLSTLPQLDSITRTLTVILALDSHAATEVRAGQIAKLQLSENITDSGYWLPTTALVRGIRGLWSCYALGKSEFVINTSNEAFRVEQREVEIIQSESDRIFVRGTLQNGDRIIVNGNHRLVPHQLVRSIDSL